MPLRPFSISEPLLQGRVQKLATRREKRIGRFPKTLVQTRSMQYENACIPSTLPVRSPFSQHLGAPLTTPYTGRTGQQVRCKRWGAVLVRSSQQASVLRLNTIVIWKSASSPPWSLPRELERYPNVHLELKRQQFIVSPKQPQYGIKNT